MERLVSAPGSGRCGTAHDPAECIHRQQQATERADWAEGERDELRAELARRRAEFIGAQARQRATFAQEQHRAEAAEAREAALREALEVGRGSFRKLIRHHRDDHHRGTQPYDQEVATGLWQMERALAADGLAQQLGIV
jgi:hypothetical protein